MNTEHWVFGHQSLQDYQLGSWCQEQILWPATILSCELDPGAVTEQWDSNWQLSQMHQYVNKAIFKHWNKMLALDRENYHMTITVIQITILNVIKSITNQLNNSKNSKNLWLSQNLFNFWRIIFSINPIIHICLKWRQQNNYKLSILIKIQVK